MSARELQGPPASLEAPKGACVEPRACARGARQRIAWIGVDGCVNAGKNTTRSRATARRRLSPARNSSSSTDALKRLLATSPSRRQEVLHDACFCLGRQEYQISQRCRRKGASAERIMTSKGLQLCALDSLYHQASDPEKIQIADAEKILAPGTWRHVPAMTNPCAPRGLGP